MAGFMFTQGVFMRNLTDKAVIVTGGGGGIGGAACRRFALEGAKVAVFDMNLQAARSVARDISDQGGTAEAFQCDIDRKSTRLNSSHVKISYAVFCLKKKKKKKQNSNQ